MTNEEIEKLVELRVKEELNKLENEGAKFVLVNGFTIEQHVNALVDMKLRKILQAIDSHNHQIVYGTYGGPGMIQISIVPSGSVPGFTKGIDY